MKLNLKKNIAIALLVLLTLIAPINSVFAEVADRKAIDIARQAAKEVVKDTGAKEIFGKNENGDLLIDKARSRASQKLIKLSQKVDSNRPLSQPEKQFLNNLQGDN